jgi:hypothetical protein
VRRCPSTQSKNLIRHTLFFTCRRTAPSRSALATKTDRLNRAAATRAADRTPSLWETSAPAPAPGLASQRLATTRGPSAADPGTPPHPEQRTGTGQ